MGEEDTREIEEIDDDEEEEIIEDDDGGDEIDAGGQGAIRLIIWLLVMAGGSCLLLMAFFQISLVREPGGVLPFSVEGPWFLFLIEVLVFLYAADKISGAFYVLPQWQRIILLRFGKFAGVKGPGVVFVMPFITAVARTLDTRTFTREFKAERALTKDSVPVTVAAVYFATLSGENPENAVLKVEDFRLTTHLSAQAALREAIGSHTLNQLLAERERVADEIKKITAERSEPFGVVIGSVVIKDILPPENLELVLAKNAAAVREAESQVTVAAAQAQIAEKLAEAARVYESNPAALTLKQLTILQEMGARAQQTIVVPTNVLGALTAEITKKTI